LASKRRNLKKRESGVDSNERAVGIVIRLILQSCELKIVMFTSFIKVYLFHVPPDLKFSILYSAQQIEFVCGNTNAN
jgi:hypothetical protein